MRYLVTGEFIDPGVLLPPEQFVQVVERVVVPSLEAIAKLEAEKKVLAAGVFAGARAGALIVEAESHTALNQLLQGLPFWGLLKWTVTPLQTFGERAVAERAAIERWKAAAP